MIIMKRNAMNFKYAHANPDRGAGQGRRICGQSEESLAGRRQLEEGTRYLRIVDCAKERLLLA